MNLDKYLEGKSMQRPPLFESDHFIYWKNRFETYVKAKDLDLWHVILNGNFQPAAKTKVTQFLEVVHFEEQSDDLKKKLAKNNEAKMVLYNALPKKEYEIIFMCKTAKDIWQSLLITQQEESIDSGFARFNTIITSLKALDEGLSSKNYVRKFLKALHPKWRAKVTAIEESNDLSLLALDKLIGNLKLHEVVMEKDSKIYRGKKERVKSIALKAKKESIDDETLTSGSNDEEYAMAVRNFKSSLEERANLLGNQEKKRSHSDKEMKRKERVTGNVLDAVIQIISLTIVQNHLATKIKRPSLEVLGAIAKMTPKAKSSNEVTLNSSYHSDDTSSLDNNSMQIEYDSLCEISLKIINKNKILKTKRDLLEKEILEFNDKIKKLERSKDIEIALLNKHTMKVKESLNVTFDESPPPTKLSPLVDNDVGEEEAIRKNTKIVNTNNEKDESIEVDEIINIKESKNHSLDQVI
ncbi:hypothetical protein Tco_0911575 [Tanacetum coccineum]|uniref:DUF4219 domain-containing protein n=1 Tax=Tanacetum coccineum TaxID=301880 RepID=A0ABQ5CX95_9ASTR